MSTNQFNINFHNYSIFESLEDRILFDCVPDMAFAVPQPGAPNQHVVQAQQVQQPEINRPRELILVNPSVENSDRLLAEILEYREDSILEIRVLDADQDGMIQITQLLSESDNKYDTVHLITGGAEGQIKLCTSILTICNLNQHADQLIDWSAALTEDATLHLYGSDLSSNAASEQLTNAISATLGTTLGGHDRECLPVIPR